MEKHLMSQEIEVSFVQKGDVYTIHTGSPVLGDIVMDYSGYAEDARGGNSSILLISAALSCFCGSVRAALVARNVPFRSLKAVGKGIKEMNAQGSMRLASLSIDVAVDLDDEWLPQLDHCAKIVKQCLITASLLDGIKVNHAIHRA